MGGPHHTQKTLQQVQTDLYNELVANAKTLLNEDIGGLEDTLKKLASNQFFKYYGYEYSDVESDVKIPPKLSPTGTVYSASGLCNIIPPDNGQISSYLKAGVFSKLDLPAWMRATAETDLADIASNIINFDTNQQWKYQEYKRTYDGQAGEKDNYVCNSVLLYCYGSLVEDGIQANMAIIYYAGVYYSAESETKQVRDEIEHNAYKSAAALSGVSSTPTNYEELKEALDSHCKPIFYNDFKYEYGTVPPESLEAGQSKEPIMPQSRLGAKPKPSTTINHYVGKNSQLCYIQDGNVDQLYKYLENQVFDGLNIPYPSVNERAINDTFNKYLSILTNAATNTWMDTSLDYTYTRADITANPVRQQGLILCWTDNKITDDKTKVTVTYIYIMVMYYTILDPATELSRDIFITLCNNLRRDITGINEDESSDDINELTDYMLDYAKQEWEKSFGFKYDGVKSDIPNSIAGHKVLPYGKLFHIKSYPASQQEVTAWMDSDVFKRTSVLFPQFARGPIYDDLVNHVLRYGSDAAPKDNNMWYTANFTEQYMDPGPTSRNLQQYASYVYALGDMTLDETVGDQEGVNAKKLFVYYLGLISSYKETSDW